MDIVYRKKSWQTRFMNWLARELTSIAYSISQDGYEEFGYDNDYGYCPDCDRCRR